MSMMSHEEAAAEAARVCAEYDAMYGNPRQMHALELHERARQQRLAERAKQQAEQDKRVAKHQALLAERRALAAPQVDPQQSAADWAKWFECRLQQAVQTELDRPDEDVPDLEKGEVSDTGIGVLLQLITKMFGNAHERTREAFRELEARIAAHQKELKAVTDDERTKLQAALDSKQKQLEELQAANALLLNRITKLEAATTADARVSDIEQRLALQQIERDRAKKGAKGDRGEKGERGAPGARVFRW